MKMLFPSRGSITSDDRSDRLQLIVKFCRELNPDRIAVLFIIIGAGLRLWQYLGNASLWVDEIALARSIIERPLGELLTGPLSFGQVAPRGFVLVQKLATMSFGANDYVLRLFPLLCGLLSLFVFWRVAKLILGDKGSLVALALFATAAPFVIYSSQVKQYSGDVLVALWLLWLALRTATEKLSLWRAAGIGAAGIVGVLFSHPAVFVIVGLGGALALWSGAKRGVDQNVRFRPLVVILLLWAIAAVVGVIVGMASISPRGQIVMQNFWARGFPPLSLSEEIKTRWPWQPLKNLLSGPAPIVTLGYPGPALSLLVMILGCWLIWRSKKVNLALLLGPIAVTLAAAAFRQYPFSDRLILFLVPHFLLLLAAGIVWNAAQLARVSLSLATVAVLYLTGVCVWPIVKQPPVYRTEEARPLLSYLQSHRKPEDTVYVYYGAWQALQYYGPTYGLSDGSYFEGDCYRGSPRRYLEELDGFRGQSRVWVVIMHEAWSYREREDILAYLHTIGVRRDKLEIESHGFSRRLPPVELWLFDLSDPERLGRATAATFAISGRTSVHPNLPCLSHSRPIRPSRLRVAER